MKKLLLRLAYGILKLYKEKPTSADLGDVIIIRGKRFVVTNYTVTIDHHEPAKAKVTAVDILEGMHYGRN